MTPLSLSGQKLLQFITYTVANSHRAPTVAEMLAAMDMTSESLLGRLLDRVEQAGAIRRVPGDAFAIEIATPLDTKLPPEIEQAISEHCARTHVSRGALLREAVTGYLFGEVR